MINLAEDNFANPLDFGHVIVFDCNIYLKVASAVGEPFSFEQVRRLARGDIPAPSVAKESAQALIFASTGKFAGALPLAICSSDHIIETVRFKAVQKVEYGDSASGGLGFGNTGAESIELNLISPLVTQSGGRVYPQVSHSASDNPPLDHEDGTVYGLCKLVKSEFPLANIWCVTNDRGFINAAVALSDADFIKVAPPRAFLSAWKAQVSRNLAPRARKNL